MIDPPGKTVWSGVIEMLEAREREYFQWLLDNAERAFKGLPLLSALPWDKSGRKILTYGDLIKRKPQ